MTDLIKLKQYCSTSRQTILDYKQANEKLQDHITNMKMTIDLNMEVLTKYLHNQSFSTIEDIKVLIKTNTSLTQKILEVIEHNKQLQYSLIHIQNELEIYPDFLNEKIKQEKAKKKVLAKECIKLNQVQSKINTELDQFRTQALFKKAHSLLIVMNPNQKALEMNTEINYITEITEKVKEYDSKEKDEVRQLEEEYETIKMKLNDLIKQIRDENEGLINPYEPSQTEGNMNHIRNIDNQIELILGSQTTNETIEAPYKTQVEPLTINNNKKSRHKKGFLKRVISMWSKSAIDNPESVLKTFDSPPNNKNDEQNKEYAKESELNKDYKLQLKRYKEFYKRLKEYPSQI